VAVVAASGDNGPFGYGIPNPYLAWANDSPCQFAPSFPAGQLTLIPIGLTSLGTFGGYIWVGYQ